MMWVASQLGDKLQIQDGYRLVINEGENGGN